MKLPTTPIMTILLLFWITSVTYGQPQTTPTSPKEKAFYIANLNKGDYFIGGTLGVETKETSNRDILLYNIDNEDNSNFSFRFDGGYAWKDNLFVGAGLQYGETRRNGNYTDNDNSSSYKQFYGNNMSFKPFIKNYVPLSDSRRFNLVTQTELSFSLSQSIRQVEQNNDITRTLLKKFEVGIGVRPGLLVFIVDKFAVETSVNVAGISYSYSKQKDTNQPDTIIKRGSIDFKIDILQLNLGFFVYL